MNTKFLSSCFTIASLSTCVLNEVNDDCLNGDTIQVPITDRISAVVSYSFICSDYMSLSDYEVHEFHIEFFRDGKLLDGLTFETKYNKQKFGSLTNPNLHVERKLTSLSDLKPGLRDKIKALGMTTLLDPDEVKAVINKSDELIKAALLLRESQKQSGR